MFLLYFPSKLQGPENSKKLLKLSFFAFYINFLGQRIKILLCEPFPCRKYTWNRPAGENLTVVPYLTVSRARK